MDHFKLKMQSISYINLYLYQIYNIYIISATSAVTVSAACIRSMSAKRP